MTDTRNTLRSTLVLRPLVNLRAASLISGLALALVACAPAPAPAPAQSAGDQIVLAQGAPGSVLPLPADVVPETVELNVDWEAAVKAVAANPPGTEAVVRPMAVGEDPPRVPILVPTGLATAQGESVSFQSTADGYFAVFPGPVYDVVVNGTGEALTGTQASAGERPEMRITATEQGLQIALTRFGADYLFEFECKGGNPTCVNEAEAEEVVSRLAVLGR
jgi:hypothetical protein